MKLAAIAVLALTQLAAARQRSTDLPYEVMWRMRELDREWLTHKSGNQRTEALNALSELRHTFLLVRIAQVIDAARFDLGNWSYANALQVTPNRRLLDSSETTLLLRFTQFHGDRSPFSWFVSFEPATSKAEDSSAEINFYDGPDSWLASIDSLSAGDHDLRLSITDADASWHKRPFHVSVVEKRDERRWSLAKALEELTDSAPLLERATATVLLAIFKSQSSGSTEDTDYPGARLLDEAEQVVAAAAKGEHLYGPEHTGQFWLELPTGGKQTTRVRMLVPKRITRDKPAALVLALHGEGFSENTFFDTYGDGQIVKLCEERDWLLVAPRLAPSGNASLTAIVDAVAERYPVDRERVFVVGHSMGANIGLDEISAAPSKFAGLAALAGGHAPANVAALKDFPVFTAAGDHDFARDEVKKLHDSLRAAGSIVATNKVFPNCEHLMICADALPEVFAWFGSL